MPVDRGAIDAQLREIGEGDAWWEQREFRALPHVLYPEERIQGIARGRLLSARMSRLKPARPWLLVVTSHRLICLLQESFARKQVELSRGQITRVDHRSRFRSCQIGLETVGARYRIRISKADAVRFVGALATLLPQQANPRIRADLEPLAWIPGMTRVAAMPAFSGIVSRMAMLSPPDYASRETVARLEATVERLQSEVEHLQQSVAFLEELLEKRANEVAVPGDRSGP